MTVFHRFFVGREVEQPCLSMATSDDENSLPIDVIDGIMRMKGIEFAQLDLVCRENEEYPDDLDLIERQARRVHNPSMVYERLRKSSCFFCIQPLAQDAEELEVFYDAIWRILFSRFPQGLLVMEGGLFYTSWPK